MAKRKSKLFSNITNGVTLHHAFTVDWSINNVGFGQVSFHPRADGKIYCDNEYMSKDFIKGVLDQLVDECVLMDKREEGDK